MKKEDTELMAKLESMYEFLCKHLQKNYYASKTINIVVKDETSLEITTSHPSYLVFNIEIQNKDEEQIFSLMLHEYLHAVLAPIGIHFRGMLEEIKSNDFLKYIIQDNLAKEEGILFALVDSLSDLLYQKYKDENRDSNSTVDIK